MGKIWRGKRPGCSKKKIKAITGRSKASPPDSHKEHSMLGKAKKFTKN